MSGPARPSAQAGDGDVSLRDVLGVLFKRKRAIVVVFLSVALGVAAVTLARPAVYEARALVIVKFGRDYVYRPEVGDQRPAIAITPEEVLNSEVQILTGDDLLQRVVAEVTVPKLFPPGRFLRRRPPSQAEAARALRKMLSVEAVKRSSILQVAFEHRDPEVAARVVNLLVEIYREKHLQVYADDKSGFLQGELAGYERKLKESEAKLEAFRQQRGVFAYGEQMTLLLRRRADLDASYRDAVIRSGELRARVKALQRKLDKKSYPLEVRTDLQRELLRTDADAKAQDGRVASLKSLRAKVSDEIGQLDRQSHQLDELRREVVENEKNYQAYRVKSEETRLAADLSRQKLADVVVVHGASVPTTPAGLGRTVKIAAGTLLGLLSAILYAFVAEALGASLSTPGAAEKRLQAPVLVSIPYRP